jgi:hypothetical protein
MHVGAGGGGRPRESGSGDKIGGARDQNGSPRIMTLQQPHKKVADRVGLCDSFRCSAIATVAGPVSEHFTEQRFDYCSPFSLLVKSRSAIIRPRVGERFCDRSNTAGLDAEQQLEQHARIG